MKKLISIVVCLSIALSLAMPIFAVDSQLVIKEHTGLTENIGLADFKDIKVTITETNGLSTHSIQFPTVQELSASNNNTLRSFDDVLSKNAERNRLIILEYVERLNLGAEAKAGYLKQIQEIPADGYLDSCTLYVPDETASSRAITYYGAYNGKVFYTEPYMEFSVNYKQTTERNLNTLNAWIQGSVDLILAVVSVPTEVSVAFAFMNLADRLLSNGYESKAGDYAEFYARCNTHVRSIITYDSEGYVGTDYCTVIQDAMMKIYPYVVYHCNPEYAGVSAVVYEDTADRLELYSEYYHNTDYNLRTGYNRYYSVPDVPLLLSNVSISNADISWSWE